MFPQAGTHKPLYTRLSWRRQQQCHQQRDDKTHERHQQQRGHQQDSCWCTHHTIHEHKQTQEQEETQEHQQHDQHNHWHAQPQEQQSQQGGVTSEQELRQVIREELHKVGCVGYERWRDMSSRAVAWRGVLLLCMVSNTPINTPC